MAQIYQGLKNKAERVRSEALGVADHGVQFLATELDEALVGNNVRRVQVAVSALESALEVYGDAQSELGRKLGAG